MMTVKDIGAMLELLEAAYGLAFYKETSQDRVVKLWSVMFADDDPAEVGIAVKDCIATLTFPPKVADIKSRIAQNRLEGQMTEGEVWQMIRKAVEDANSVSEAKAIFEGMPEIVRKVAGSPSQLRAWRSVSDEQFETVIMSSCARNYRIYAAREAGYHALPGDIQKAEPWRIETKKQEKLPAPEEPKRLGFEKPDWMIRREQMEADAKAAAAKRLTEPEPDPDDDGILYVDF